MYQHDQRQHLGCMNRNDARLYTAAAALWVLFFVGLGGTFFG